MSFQNLPRLKSLTGAHANSMHQRACTVHIQSFDAASCARTYQLSFAASEPAVKRNTVHGLQKSSNAHRLYVYVAIQKLSQSWSRCVNDDMNNNVITRARDFAHCRIGRHADSASPWCNTPDQCCPTGEVTVNRVNLYRR